HAVLASRSFALRHRARRGDAREGEATRHRPDLALSLSTVPIVNARMYSVAPTAAANWRTVLSWVLLQAELDWPFVDVPPPTPIADLWGRGDLGLAMMCGLPYGQRVAAARGHDAGSAAADARP